MGQKIKIKRVITNTNLAVSVKEIGRTLKLLNRKLQLGFII